MESRLKATGEATAAQAAGPGAAARAVAEARRGLEGEPALVLAFPSGIGPGELAEQLADADGIPVAGLSGNGAIGEDGPVEEGCAAIALAGATLARLGPERGNDAVLLLLDTRTGDQSEAIAGAYAAAGPGVPLAGGA